jgi:hypothetical protein
VNLHYLQQADAILTKCGRPLLPGGITAVPIPKGFLMPMVLQPGAVTTFTKEITGDSPWVLRAISCDNLYVASSPDFTAIIRPGTAIVGIRIQIQLPNGRFMFGGNGIDIGQLAWIGSWRWLHDPELRCEPGGKINVTLTDNRALGGPLALPLIGPASVNLLFEGAYLYFMRGGQQVPPVPDVSTWPRYQGNANENILAPAWMSNEGVATPAGFADEYFVYCTPDPIDSPQLTQWSLVTFALTARPQPFEVAIDAGYEFFVRRILVDIKTTGGVSGIVLGRVRTGAGYAVNESMIDLASYLTGAETACNFKVEGGDSIFIDTDLADYGAAIGVGTGTITFQVFFEGYRRRRVK